MSDKNVVYEQYNNIAEWFDNHRSRDFFEKPYFDKVISLLEPHAKILDIGCGMGEPIAEYFIKQGFQVTGIDGSEKLIQLAKKRFPTTQFIVQDMRTLALNEKFNCLIAWHSFFHLNKEEQKKMFDIFAAHIKQNGILIFTSGPDAGEEWSNNGGELLYHASLSAEEYQLLLKQHHFKLLTHMKKDSSCGGATVWIAMYEGIKNASSK